MFNTKQSSSWGINDEGTAEMQAIFLLALKVFDQGLTG
jgi:hypothetical protein